MSTTTTPQQRKGAPPVGLRAQLRSDPRLRQPGWVLLPLRAFLGVTFVYAGLSKLFDRHYLDGASPLGVHSQMVHAAATSPISGLVNLSAGHAVLTGLLIAFGEIGVGIGVLLGLLTRLAALGGMLLALSFFLTVSWTTSPYYYGPDIVFLFAWMPLLLAGDGGVLSVSARIRARVREQLKLPPVPTSRETSAVGNEVERRTLIRGGMIAGIIGVVTVAGGTALAMLRRGHTSTVATKPSGSTPSPSTSASPSASGGASKVIAAVSEVPVGKSKSFKDASGNQAFLLQPTAGTFVAYSAICTHQGCPVQFVGPGFQCPCHGSTFDQNGQVTAPPANRPLAKIPVKVVNDQVEMA